MIIIKSANCDKSQKFIIFISERKQMQSESIIFTHHLVSFIIWFGVRFRFGFWVWRWWYSLNSISWLDRRCGVVVNSIPPLSKWTTDQTNSLKLSRIAVYRCCWHHNQLTWKWMTAIFRWDLHIQTNIYIRRYSNFGSVRSYHMHIVLLERYRKDIIYASVILVL